MEELTIPLSVNDMNYEIIKYLDDDSLYNLCATNKSVQSLCMSQNIWYLDRPSKLKHLHFLRDNYDSWLDFYENVTHDYIYVSLIENYNGVYQDIIVAADITEIYNNIIDSIRRLHHNNIDIDDLPKYITDNRSYKIGLARRNIERTIDNPYEYELYSVNKNRVTHVPSFLLWPKLKTPPDTKFLMIASKRVIYGSAPKDRGMYYCTFDNNNLHIITDKNYNAFTLYHNSRIYMAFNKRQTSRIFRISPLIKTNIGHIIYLAADNIVDGTDTFYLITADTKTHEIFMNNEIFNDKMFLERLRNYGTYYKLKDLFNLL